MNDEIREILDYLKNADYSPVFADEGCDDTPYKLFDETEVKLLLDYITNLQQEIQKKEAMYDSLAVDYRLAQEENERLKEENKHIFSKVNDDELLISNAMNYAEAQDYKSRIEKAVEYNNQIITDTKDFYRPTEDIIYSGNTIIDIATNNINILQNGSDASVKD